MDRTASPNGLNSTGLVRTSGILRKALDLLVSVTVLCSSAWASQAESRAATPAPLPDATAFLTKVQENQKAIDALVEQYACRKSVQELDVNKDGSLRNGSEKDYEVFYLGGREVERMVAQDGKPLSAAKQQEETTRVEKRVREFLRKRQKQEARAARGEKEEEPGISTFLRVSRFTNPRRVEFRGADVVAFDFEPIPNYRPKTRLEKVLQGLVGTAWVDDRANEIVKLEAHFARPLKFGGFLASVRPGSAFVFEQTLVNNEVWLPSYAEIHVSGRILFKGLKVNQIVRYSDYKKFRVEMVSKPGA